MTSFNNQMIQQATLVPQDSRDRNQGVTRLALFDQAGNPVDLSGNDNGSSNPLSPFINPAQRALLQKATKPVRIVSVGDSHTETVGATNHMSGWVPRVAKALGENEFGYEVHLSPRGNQAINSVDIQFDENSNPHMVLLAQTSSRVTWFNLPACDIQVMWLRVGEPEALQYGPPEFSFNETTFRSDYAANTPVYSPGTVWMDSLVKNFPGGTFAIRKHATAPEGSYVVGIRLVFGSGRVSWFNWARSGYTTKIFADRLRPDPDGMWALREVFQAWPPDILHIGLGANDAVQGFTPGQIETNTNILIDEILGFPQVPDDMKLICTLSPYGDRTVSALGGPPPSKIQWDAAVEAVSDVVVQRGGVAIDLRTQGLESQNLDLYIHDDHWNDAGHLDISNRVKRYLL